MTDFTSIISRHEEKKRNLRIKVDETWRLRDKTPQNRTKWIKAAQEYREFTSELDDLVADCLKYGIEHDSNLREFVFAYIECDPYFYRSGYILEKLIQKVKKLNLTHAEKKSIQRLLIRRIETRALRNFRKICRLIPKVETEGFYREVCNRSKSRNLDVKRRAEFAIEYFPIDRRM